MGRFGTKGRAAALAACICLSTSACGYQLGSADLLNAAALAIAAQLGATGLSTSVLSMPEDSATGSSYTLFLRNEPAEPVFVLVTPGTALQVAGNAQAFTARLDANNWSSGVEHTVLPIDDAIVQGNRESTITHVVSAGDPDFLGKDLGTLTVRLLDNDVNGLNRTPTTITAAEGGANGTYSISMTSQPTANVVITIAGDGQAGPTASPITFTSANWTTPQTVAIQAVDDGSIESTTSSTITHSVSSSDPFYHGFALGNVAANVTDNDPANIQLSLTGFNPVIAPFGTLTLQNNGGNDLVVSGNGTHTFSNGVLNGGAYSVTVSSQAPGRTCDVSNGTGTVSGSHVTNISVVCDIVQFVGRYNATSLNATGDDITVTASSALVVTMNRALGWAPAGNCPGCVAPTVVGIAGNPSPSKQCISGSRTYVPPAAPVFAPLTYNLTAPGTPGTYFIHAWTAWDFCGNMLPAFTTHGTPIARVIVTP